MTTYRVVRMYRDSERPNQVIKRHLSLEQAQAHCKNPETSSSTCTTAGGKERTKTCGPWFDGYEEEK